MLLGLHLPRDGLQLLPELLGLLVIFFDLAEPVQQVFVLGSEVLVADDEFRQDQNVADGGDAARQVVSPTG